MRRDKPVKLLEEDLGPEAFAGLSKLDHYFYLTTACRPPNNYCARRRRRSNSWKRGSERKVSYFGSTFRFVSAGDLS